MTICFPLCVIIISHVASGKHATPEMENDILSAGRVGSRKHGKVHRSANNRLSTSQKTDFRARLPMSGPKTFASSTNESKTITKTNAQQESTAIIACLYNIGIRGHASRDELMSYKLTSVARSLPDEDGANLGATKR